MKFRALFVSVLPIVAILAAAGGSVVACGGAEVDAVPPVGGFDAGRDAANVRDGGGSAADSGKLPEGPKCAPSCTKDDDCATTCPAAAAGNTNCCDTTIGVCYKAGGNNCPAINVKPDGGSMY